MEELRTGSLASLNDNKNFAEISSKRNCNYSAADIRLGHMNSLSRGCKSYRNSDRSDVT
jgi:hypothetical protein